MDAKKRFGEIFSLQHEEHNLSNLAITYGVTETTIRNYKSGTSSPPKDTLNGLLKTWGVFDEFYNDCDDTWSNCLDAYKPSLLIADVSIARPVWFYPGGEIDLLESQVEPGRKHICIVTDDAYNDTQLENIPQAIKNNLSHGISYLYVTLRSCNYLEDLKEKVNQYRRYILAENLPSRVDIMIVEAQQATNPEWRFIDHYMIFFNNELFKADKVIANLEDSMIHSAFEQIYKNQDQPYSDTAWIVTPLRKQRILLRFLEEWSAPASWY